MDATIAPLAAEALKNMMVWASRREGAVHSKVIRSSEKRNEDLLGDCPLYRRFGSISKGVHPQQHLLQAVTEVR